MNKLYAALTVAALSAFGPTGVAHAGVAGGGGAGCLENDCRPCVTHGEWDNVELGHRLVRVSDNFDSHPDISDIWNPGGPHGRHMRSIWRTPGKCTNGSDVIVYFLPADNGDWHVEAKCYEDRGTTCIWNH